LASWQTLVYHQLDAQAVREVKKAAPGTFNGLEEARIRRDLAESPPTKRLNAQHGPELQKTQISIQIILIDIRKS
jgi:hypothetical protein